MLVPLTAVYVLGAAELCVPPWGHLSFALYVSQHMFKWVDVLRFPAHCKWRKLSMGVVNEPTVR